MRPLFRLLGVKVLFALRVRLFLTCLELLCLSRGPALVERLQGTFEDLRLLPVTVRFGSQGRILLEGSAVTASGLNGGLRKLLLNVGKLIERNGVDFGELSFSRNIQDLTSALRNSSVFA